MNWWLFILGFIFDFLYIIWLWSVEKKQAFLAGICSISIVGIGLTGIFESIDNRLNLVPYMLGLFMGSYCGVKWKK